MSSASRDPSSDGGVSYAWADHPRAGEITPDVVPTDGLESVIVRTGQPGAYTVILSGAGGATGVGIVEVFEFD